MPSDRALRGLNAFHHTVLRFTRGRIGWSAGGMPVLELTTTGRRSGRPHTVMLTSPLQEGDTIVIVASRGGDDLHPSWFHNLSDDPTVRVTWQGRSTRQYRARVATDAERERLWPRVVTNHTRYGGYQAKTDREIPLVLLEPTD